MWIYPPAFVSFKIYFAPCWKQIEVRYIFQLFPAIQSTNAFAKHLSPKDKLQHEKSFDEHDYVIYFFIAQPFVSCKYSGENNFFETVMCLMKFGRNA